MTEPEEVETEETTTNEFREVTTDAADIDVTSATIKTDDTTKYESIKYEDVELNVGKDRKREKKKSWKERCRDTWTCEEEPLWRIYMKS